MRKLIYVIAVLLFAIPVFSLNELLASQTQNTDTYWLGYNGDYKYLRTNFTVSVNGNIGNISTYLKKTGTFACNVNAVLFYNNGSLMGVSNNTLACNDLTTSYVLYNFQFSNRPEVVAGGQYWISVNMTPQAAGSTETGWGCKNSIGGFTIDRSADASSWTVYQAGAKCSHYIYNASAVETAPPPDIPKADFYNTSIKDNYVNNTLGQNITANCSYNGGVIIRFGTTNPPASSAVVVSGTASQNYWTINSSIVTGNGVYYYQANCSNSSSTPSAVRTYTYDTTVPVITLGNNNFIDTSNRTIQSNVWDFNQLRRINISFTDNRAIWGILLNITLPNGTSKYSNETLNISNNITHITFLNISTWPRDKVYTLDLWASDTHTAEIIPPYDLSSNKGSLVFTTEKNTQLTITPKDAATATAEYKGDRYSFNFDFSDSKTSRVFDVISDKKIYAISNSEYAGHLVIGTAKGGNWVDFESSNLAGKPVVTKIDDNHYQVTLSYKAATDAITFNSVGGLNTAHKTYQWYYGDYTISAPDAVSGEPFKIYINFTKNMSFLGEFQADFRYNNTYYSANITHTNSSTHEAFVVNLAGFSVGADTTLPYNFTVNITQIPTLKEQFVFSGYNSIFNFLLDNCTTATMPTAVFNVQSEDETTLPLNATLEMEGTYFVYGTPEVKTFSQYVYSASSYSLCIYPNSSNIYSDLYIKYTTIGGFTHRYYLVNQSFTNTSTTFYLYNFNTTTGLSDMRITLRNSQDYSYYENVIAKLQRFYVSENTWRTVQMDESGDYGLVFFNIYEEDTDYRLVYMDRSNNVLLTTTSMKFSCTSGICDLTQKLTPYSATTASTTLGHSITYNNQSRIINFSWSTATDSTTRAIVTRETTTGTTTLCDSSQTGTSGNIYCNTTGYSGLFVATVQKDGVIKGTSYFTAPDTKLFNFVDKAEGAIWSFAIMVTVMGFGLFSPVGVIIAALFGLLVIYFMGLMSAITITFIIIAAVLGIAIGIKVRT